MIVSEHMTNDPVAVAPDETVDAALRLMDECSIRHLPVMHHGCLIGIVSDRDLLGAAAWRLSGSDDTLAKRVREVMHRDVTYAAPDDQIVSALVELSVSGIGCLPVREGEVLVGMVTEHDLMTLYSKLCGDAGTVSTLAHAQAVVVAPDATAAEVDELCHQRGFRHLPVVEDGRLVGMLSDRDLRRRQGRDLEPNTPVSVLMATQVITTRPDEPLSSAVGRMLTHKISALPVVGAGDAIGILTSVDILEDGLAVVRDQASA